MFEGFSPTVVDVGDGIDIACVVGGSGPAVLLLHGAPQTHAMWHELGPALSENYTVIASDLRGYGDSSKPASDADHETYSFRAMATDQARLMTALGHHEFAVIGHDRGARVTHRLLLDHPERIRGGAILDVLPTAHLYGNVTRELATAYWHWFALIQPEPLPEDLITPAPLKFLHHVLNSFGSTASVFAPEAMAEYERCFDDPSMIHAMCEDYRAAASIDLVHDRASGDRRIECPLLILWGSRGVVGRYFDPLDVWQQYATNVRGAAIDAGHFLAEEQPAETLREIEAFLKSLPRPSGEPTRAR
ncbi:alpha/beta hydrolase [Streptomyces sp. NPDC051985]|uniref:alpha/beta fold hydrolase n=1 Tax=Streptomyces sp. NPDC051985 TaxID=3155807 RepID=UPI00342C5256